MSSPTHTAYADILYADPSTSHLVLVPFDPSITDRVDTPLWNALYSENNISHSGIQAEGPINRAIVSFLQLLVPPSSKKQFADATFRIDSDEGGKTLRDVCVKGGKTYAELPLTIWEEHWSTSGRSELGKAIEAEAAAIKATTTTPVSNSEPATPDLLIPNPSTHTTPTPDVTHALTSAPAPAQKKSKSAKSKSSTTNQTVNDNFGNIKPDLMGIVISITSKPISVESSERRQSGGGSSSSTWPPRSISSSTHSVSGQSADLLHLLPRPPLPRTRRSRGSEETHPAAAPTLASSSSSSSQAHDHAHPRAHAHAYSRIGKTSAPPILSTLSSDPTMSQWPPLPLPLDVSRVKDKGGKRKQRTEEIEAKSAKETASDSETSNTMRLKANLEKGKTLLMFLVGEVKPNKEQTKEGLIKLCIYLLKAFQMCGCWIGLVFIHNRFARVVVIKDNVLAVETTSEQLWTTTGLFGEESPHLLTLSRPDLLTKCTFEHLPHCFYPDHGKQGPRELVEKLDISATRTLWETCRIAADQVKDLAIDQALTPLAHPTDPHFHLSRKGDARGHGHGQDVWSELRSMADSQRPGAAFTVREQEDGLQMIIQATGPSARQKRLRAALAARQRQERQQQQQQLEPPGRPLHALPFEPVSSGPNRVGSELALAQGDEEEEQNEDEDEDEDEGEEDGGGGLLGHGPGPGPGGAGGQQGGSGGGGTGGGGNGGQGPSGGRGNDQVGGAGSSSGQGEGRSGGTGMGTGISHANEAQDKGKICEMVSVDLTHLGTVEVPPFPLDPHPHPMWHSHPFNLPSSAYAHAHAHVHVHDHDHVRLRRGGSGTTADTPESSWSGSSSSFSSPSSSWILPFSSTRQFLSTQHSDSVHFTHPHLVRTSDCAMSTTMSYPYAGPVDKDLDTTQGDDPDGEEEEEEHEWKNTSMAYGLLKRLETMVVWVSPATMDRLVLAADR